MKRITSRDNPTVKQLHALATSARERRACGETLLDGAHLLGVALERGWQPRLVVASESGRAQPEIAALLARCNAQSLIELPDRLFAHVSPVDSPSGVLAVVAVPAAPAAGTAVGPLTGNCVLLDDGRRVEPEQVIVYPQADAATHSVTVRLPLPASGPVLMPGTTVKVVFPAIGGEVALPVVPVSAVLQRGEVSAVYVLRDGRPELRQIRIGERSGDLVRVISGLKTGEKVAADPVAALEWMAAVREGENPRE